MRTVVVVTILTLSIWCPIWKPLTAFGEDKAAGETRPLLVLTGADSCVDKPAYHRVNSQEAWQQLWLSHLGKTEADSLREHLPIVQIDFTKCMVIGIFKGAATNSRGFNIISVDENEDTVSLQFDDMSYQTSGGLGGGGGGSVQVTPYAFVVIPKSARLVLVEENVQSLKDQQPVWKERARLKAEEERAKQGDSVKVVVEGSLGTIVRQVKTDSVTATVVAAGGEFVIDASASKTAREDVLRLADKYIKDGSTSIVAPQLKVTGRLEFRATEVVGEKGEATDGPKVWVLVADSVAVTKTWPE